MILAMFVCVAAAVGAVGRYVLDVVIQRRHERIFPFGTVTINVLGSFALGLVTGLEVHHGLDSDTAIVVGIGFCGGFTTFSTWTWETLALAEAGAVLQATANIVGSLILGLAAAAAGLALALL